MIAWIRNVIARRLSFALKGRADEAISSFLKTRSPRRASLLLAEDALLAMTGEHFLRSTLYALLLLTLLALRSAPAYALSVTAGSLSNTSITAESLAPQNGTTLQFTLDGPAHVDISVYNKADVSLSTVVTTLRHDYASGGPQSVFWNGLWNIGSDLFAGRQSGNYKFSIVASSGDVTSNTFWIDSPPLTINSVDIHSVSVLTSYDAAGSPAFPFSVNFALAKDARVTILIKNSSNATVRTLLGAKLRYNEAVVPLCSILWDGLDDQGRPVPIGTYTVTLNAADTTTSDYATERSWSVSVLSLASLTLDPQKIFADNAYVYPNPVRDGEATLNFQAIRENAAVHVKIYTLTGDLVYSKTFGGLASGNVNLQAWHADNSSGNKLGRGLYYVVFREESPQGVLQTVKKVAIIR
jgi:flagellar hook assembly protein FlgD